MDRPDDLIEAAASLAAPSGAGSAFLLADSRLLFGSVGATTFADLVAASLRDTAGAAGPRAAYLGAGTNDRREFYELYELFAEKVGCLELCQVYSTPTGGERAFLSGADLVVIGGGDALLAFRAFEASSTPALGVLGLAVRGWVCPEVDAFHTDAMAVRRSGGLGINQSRRIPRTPAFSRSRQKPYPMSTSDER